MQSPMHSSPLLRHTSPHADCTSCCSAHHAYMHTSLLLYCVTLPPIASLHMLLSPAPPPPRTSPRSAPRTWPSARCPPRRPCWGASPPCASPCLASCYQTCSSHFEWRWKCSAQDSDCEKGQLYETHRRTCSHTFLWPFMTHDDAAHCADHHDARLPCLLRGLLLAAAAAAGAAAGCRRCLHMQATTMPSCTKTAPRQQHNCTETAPKLHQNCTESAPQLHHHCRSTAPNTQTAPKLHRNCTKTAPKLHHNCTEDAPTLHQDYTKHHANKLHHNCSTNT